MNVSVESASNQPPTKHSYNLSSASTPQCSYLSQQLGESQNLSNEDANTDVNAGNEAQEASQVLGGYFTEVHRHHTERDTWGETEVIIVGYTCRCNI